MIANLHSYNYSRWEDLYLPRYAQVPPYFHLIWGRTLTVRGKLTDNAGSLGGPKFHSLPAARFEFGTKYACTELGARRCLCM